MARNKYDIDEELENKFDLNQIKRLGKYIGNYKKDFIIAIVIMIISSALTMLQPMLLKDVLEVVENYVKGNDITKSDAIMRICVDGALMLIVTLVVVMILKAKIKITNNIGQNIIYELRRDLFVHLQELPFSYYDDKPHGKIQVRVVNYVNNLSDLLSNGIVNTITDMFSLIFIVAYMFILDVRFALMALMGLPVLIAIVWIVKTRQRRAWQNQSNKQSNLNAYIAESINGIRVTQSFVREEENTEIFNRLNKDAKSAWLNAVKYNFIMNPVVENITSITTAVIYMLGANWIFNGNTTMSIPVMVTFIIYVSRFWAPITTLASFYNSLLTAISYLERIFETITGSSIVSNILSRYEIAVSNEL